MRFALVAAVNGALFLVSAKTHGRQLRLERELRGYWEVTFGGSNPPFVEALWRRDRVRFWVLVPSLAAIAIALMLLKPAPITVARVVSVVLAGATGAASLGFLALSALSGLRWFRLIGDANQNGGGKLVGAARETWVRTSIRGSAFWFGLAVALCGILAHLQ